MQYLQSILVTSFLIGTFFIAYLILLFTRFIYTFFIRKSYNLSERYGHKSWVFITASSDGIGKGFAIAFAKRGFNIILSARNLQKLKQTQLELKKINSNIQTKIIVADFKQAQNKQFYQRILEQMKDLDVSVLVNNVGIPTISLFNMNPFQVNRYLSANARCMSLFSQIFIKKFKLRKNKSAIINLSSLMKYLPLGHANLYGSTKKFNDFLSRSLSYEYPDIDIISFAPSFVSTPATLNLETDLFVIKVEVAVESLLKDLGYEISSNGGWTHKLQDFILRNIDERIGLFLRRYAPKKYKEMQDFYNKK